MIVGTGARIAAQEKTPQKSKIAPPQTLESWLEWPGFPWLLALGIIAIYTPDFLAIARQWLTNDNYAHGIFVYPLACFLIWLQRDSLRQAQRKPENLGLLFLALGLLVQMGSSLLRMKYFGMWSLLPTLAGAVLILFGRDVWRIVQFPVWFLLFADPIPQTWLIGLMRWIQGISIEGSYTLMSGLGFALIKQGNLIQVPGATLEVAQACSGFHKLFSLLTFSCLYSYLISASVAKKGILIVAAIPIAVLINILRISLLIAATSEGGMALMHRVHDSAEIMAIVIGFALFILLGKVLGCKFTSSSQPSAV